MSLGDWQLLRFIYLENAGGYDWWCHEAIKGQLRNMIMKPSRRDRLATCTIDTVSISIDQLLQSRKHSEDDPEVKVALIGTMAVSGHLAVNSSSWQIAIRTGVFPFVGRWYGKMSCLKTGI